MKNKIIELANKYDADLVGFAPADRFDQEDAVFKIFLPYKNGRILHTRQPNALR